MSRNMDLEIYYKGVDINVVGNYTPEEPMVMYYPDGSGHPGSPAEFEIEEIYYGDVDVFDIYDGFKGAMDEIQELCITKVEENYD